MKEINLEEIIQQCIGIRPGAKNTTSMDYYECKFVMKELAKQLLELAAENATILNDGMDIGNYYHIPAYEEYLQDSEFTINKQSILDTINQIK